MLIAGILLAAGRGSRFGGDKLLAKLPAATHLAAAGTPIGVASARHLEAGMRAGAVHGGDPCTGAPGWQTMTLAVVRAGDTALAQFLAGEVGRVVTCPEADDGMGASLASGVTAAAAADGWVVALADMPWIAPSTIASIAAAIANGAPIAAPVYAGRRGHPVGFASRYRDALQALSGDEGARRIVDDDRERLVLVAVDDPGIARDVDDRSQLAAGAAAPAPASGGR